MPDVCKCYTEKILPIALDLWQEYLDFTAHQNLMKAKAEWASGLNRDAAFNAVEYLAEIPADSKYYEEALKLMEEIKTRVGEDIEYERAIEAFYEKLLHAAHEVGFFYLVGHGISEELCDKLRAQSKEFFHLPLEVKQKIALENSKHFRGYTAVGGEYNWKVSGAHRYHLDNILITK